MLVESIDRGIILYGEVCNALKLLRFITDIVCFTFSSSLLFMHIEGGLQPSRRRSLFTLASYMLIFSARAGNLPELIPLVKASVTGKTVSIYSFLVVTSFLEFYFF